MSGQDLKYSMLLVGRLLLLCCLLVALPARAELLQLVLSEAGGPYIEFENTLRDALEGGRWKIQAANDASAPDLIVTAGASALRQVLARNPSQSVLATLIPKQAYEKMLSEFSGHLPRRISAIWLDQPPGRQAAFIRHLLPGNKKIGLLLSNETRPLFSPFQRAFSNQGLSLDSEESDGDRNLLPTLNSLLPRVGLLLAVPDSSIYRRDNIKAILVTTYRHQKPVVAFSAALVNAGALAAIYSTPAQIARQTAETIQQSGANLGNASGPNLFAISLNGAVAQSLDLNLPDEAALRRALIAEKEAK